MLLGNPVKRTRLLAFLLLAAFGWGTAAEFNHHHGIKVGPGQALLTAAQDSIVSEPASSLESEGTSGTSSTSKTSAACLICQLHQNLSASLFSEPPGVGPTETRAIKATDPILLHLSEYTANQHGRAPPIDSLS